MKAMRLVCLSALVLGTMSQLARAGEWDQKSVFTFIKSVEVPGQVLEPGTYVFKLMDSASDRNVVQVFNREETHLFGTFLAISDYRLKPANKPIITFEERAPGSPEAVRAWFYPGENYGHDFVYPKQKAVELAKANDTPVASMPAELAINTTAPAPTEPQVTELKTVAVVAQKPTDEEVATAEVFAAELPASLPDQLPTTGSNLPLIGIAGLLSLGIAFGFRFARGEVR